MHVTNVTLSLAPTKDPADVYIHAPNDEPTAVPISAPTIIHADNTNNYFVGRSLLTIYWMLYIILWYTQDDWCCR